MQCKSGETGNTSDRTTAFAGLVRAQYLSLTTYRRTGEAVTTPVWFAEDGGTLYVRTWPGAGKVKRIAHSPRVSVAACTVSGRVTGPEIEASASLASAEEEQAAEAALARKYRLLWWAYFRVYGRLRRGLRAATSPRAYLGLTAAAEQPSGA